MVFTTRNPAPDTLNPQPRTTSQLLRTLIEGQGPEYGLRRSNRRFSIPESWGEARRIPTNLEPFPPGICNRFERVGGQVHTFYMRVYRGAALTDAVLFPSNVDVRTYLLTGPKAFPARKVL